MSTPPSPKRRPKQAEAQRRYRKHRKAGLKRFGFYADPDLIQYILVQLVRTECVGRASPTCAESIPQNNQINELAEKSALHFFAEDMGSGSVRERRQRVFGNAHALGQNDAETIKKCGLGGVGLSDAAQANLTVRCGRQDNVVRLDAGNLLEDGAR